MNMEGKFYTVKQVANQLNLAEITIRQWIMVGKIESIKIGRARRIPESEVMKLMKGDK